MQILSSGVQMFLPVHAKKPKKPKQKKNQNTVFWHLLLSVCAFVWGCVHGHIYLTIPPCTPPRSRQSLLSEVSSSSVMPLDSNACRRRGLRRQINKNSKAQNTIVDCSVKDRENKRQCGEDREINWLPQYQQLFLK